MAVNIDTVSTGKELEALRSVALDAAEEILGCKRSRLFELLAQGELRSFKVGRQRRILLCDLQAFIEAQTEANR